MIACDIIASFYIFRLLKYDRIFGKNLGAWYLGGKIKSLFQHFAGGLAPGLVPEIYVSFLYDTFK